MSIAFDTLRVGKRYLINNYGEISRFEIMERTAEGDFIIKDLISLERYRLSDLVRYGKSKDFDLLEIR